MIKKSNKIMHSAISIMLSVAIAVTGVNISNITSVKSVSAASINPVDTGNGYEYSQGRAIGMALGNNGCMIEDVGNVVLDEYNMSDCKYETWGGYKPISIEKKIC